MTRATILEKNFNNDFWPELVLAMTYIKNNWPTKAIQNLSSYKTLIQNHLDILYLRILGFTIYIFLHKEKKSLK